MRGGERHPVRAGVDIAHGRDLHAALQQLERRGADFSAAAALARPYKSNPDAVGRRRRSQRPARRRNEERP